MKVLWCSNAPWAATGYANQTDLVSRSLLADGHDVALFSNYGLAGSKMDWNCITVLPSGYDVWGNDVIAGHARNHFGDSRGLVITLFDVWVAQSQMWAGLDIASWVPVDHVPVPPKVLKYFAETNATAIAMSQFGQRLLSSAGVDALYAPHGVDTTLFQPEVLDVNGVSPRDLFGVPADAFVVGMNAANKGNIKIRKSFPQAFAAFGMFVKDHPDAVLLVHSEMLGMGSGVHLPRLAEACGIPAANIVFTEQYAYKMGLSPQAMVALYQAMDVLMAPSMGEGFGIPVVEAQACGVPVIVSDFSAQPELVGSGWLIDGLPDWEEGQGAWLHLPNINTIVDALGEAYRGKGIPANARAKALEYDHQLVFDTYWRPILKVLEAKVSPPQVDVSPVDVSAL